VANIIAAASPRRPRNDGQDHDRAVEPFVNAGYPLDAEAILLCESDGNDQEVSEEIGRMKT